MQVSAPVSPKALAQSLTDLWRAVVQGREDASLALVAELGLTLTQVKALFHLQASEEAISVGELAERLGISLAATSRTVEGLLKRGWLRRRECEHDRRIREVSLTPAGRRIADRIHTARMQGLEAFAASLTDDQRARLNDALEAVLRG